MREIKKQPVVVYDVITFSNKHKAKRFVVIGKFIHHEENCLMITCKCYLKDGTKCSHYFMDNDKKYFVRGHLSTEERDLLSRFDMHGGTFPFIKSLKP